MGRRRKSRHKQPRTLRHLAESPSDGERQVPAPLTAAPEGRILSRRLAWSSPPPTDIAISEWTALIRHPNNARVKWFIDSNMFIAPTEQLIWDALLDFPGRLVLPLPLVGELQAWLKNSQHNQGVRNLVSNALASSRGSPIHVADFPPSSTVESFSAEYYVNLLGLRKRAGDIAIDKLTAELARAPTAQEISNYCKDNLGLRGQLIARKGTGVREESHKFNDEKLVALAAIYALTTGSEVAILTRDEDVFEQFYKLLWLIDTHYRSMLLAEKYAFDPSFASAMRAKDGVGDVFEGEIILLQKPSNNLEELLPSAWSPVHVHCILLRECKIATLTFCAEQEMVPLLHLKARTAGKSTDKFGERNCHVYLGTMIPKEFADYAVIGKDICFRLPGARFEFSLVDMHLTFVSEERVQRIRSADDVSQADTSR
jgi:hypothetical protein